MKSGRAISYGRVGLKESGRVLHAPEEGIEFLLLLLAMLAGALAASHPAIAERLRRVGTSVLGACRIAYRRAAW
jgi:hypothetical protein